MVINLSTIILLTAAIVLFLTFVLALSFPEVATSFYSFWTEACGYLAQGANLLWLFVPRSLALALLTIIIAMEVLYRSIILFVWIYNKIKP